MTRKLDFCLKLEINHIRMKPNGIIRKIIQGAVVFAGICYFTFSAEGQSYTNAFLNTNFGARQLGMGNASTSNTFDLHAGFWNPAGLARLEVPLQIGMMHHRWLGNQVTQNAFSLSARISAKNKSALSVNILQSSANNIPNSRLLVGPEGNINTERISAFSSADNAAMLAFGQNLGTSGKWSWGTNAKILYRNPGSSAKAWGFGMDAGMLYHNEKFALAFHVIDLISVNRWYFSISEEEKRLILLSGNLIPLKKTEIALPRAVFGGSYFYRSSKINAVFSAEIQMSSSIDQQAYFRANTLQFLPRIGVELQFFKWISIRTGIISFDRKAGGINAASGEIAVSPAAGIGIKLKRFKIDYGFTSSEYLTPALPTHLLSVKLDFIPKTSPDGTTSK